MKKALFAIAIVFGLVVCASSAQAQATRVTRMLVPFAAGGPADFVARSLAEKLSGPLGMNVIIENRPGANGSIAAQAVAKGEPDGTLLLFATSGMLTISPILEKDLPYNPLRDLAPVARAVSNGTALIVGANVPANNVRELVQLAKSSKTPLAFGSAGNGNILHLHLELFNNAAKVDITHVPYKGIAPAVTDVIGGQITGAFADLPISLPQIRAGKVKALGLVGMRRSGAAPEIPTIEEQGVLGVDGISWFGVLAPGKTPPDVVKRVSEAIAKALSDPELKQKLQAVGSDPTPNTPDEMVKLIQGDQARWAKIIAERKITVQ
jgi:tripartite-type tricarboxylate transporter receptor subunit TctC